MCRYIQHLSSYGYTLHRLFADIEDWRFLLLLALCNIRLLVFIYVIPRISIYLIT